ncbi:MAG TPA: hypothetical protein VF422_09995 [Dokdonella sp.]
MSVKLAITSDDFIRDLRRLPDNLSSEGGDMVVAQGTAAKEDIQGLYAAASVTGNLEKHVSLSVVKSQFGVIAEVKSTARHAFIYENGTQIRKNKAGKNLGAMPPAHVFIPRMQRARRLLTEDLTGLLERAGLVVRRV